MNWETKAKSLKLNAGWWMQRSSFRCRSPFSNITKCWRASLIRALWKMETEVVVFWDVCLNNWLPVMWLASPSPALSPCSSWDCQCESGNPTRKDYSRGGKQEIESGPYTQSEMNWHFYSHSPTLTACTSPPLDAIPASDGICWVPRWLLRGDRWAR